MLPCAATGQTMVICFSYWQAFFNSISYRNRFFFYVTYQLIGIFDNQVFRFFYLCLSYFCPSSQFWIRCHCL